MLGYWLCVRMRRITVRRFRHLLLVTMLMVVCVFFYVTLKYDVFPDNSGIYYMVPFIAVGSRDWMQVEKEHYRTLRDWRNSIFKKHNYRQDGKEVLLLMVSCQSYGTDVFRNQSRQYRQAVTMIKSAVLFSEDDEKIKLLILADSLDLYQKLNLFILTWPDNYQKKIEIFYSNIMYPEGWETYREFFRPCGTARYLLDSLLPFVDSVLYVDTDLIFFGSVQELWKKFSNFSSKEVMSLGGYIMYNNEYLPVAANSTFNNGVALMNLTRMRELDMDVTAVFYQIYLKYKRIMFYSQEIFQIFFARFPHLLHRFPCQWNFLAENCLSQVDMDAERLCPAAQTEGVSVLHGTAGRFIRNNDKNVLFNKIFAVFEKYKLGSDVFLNLYVPLLLAINDVERDNPGYCRGKTDLKQLLLTKIHNKFQGRSLDHIV